MVSFGIIFIRFWKGQRNRFSHLFLSLHIPNYEDNAYLYDRDLALANKAIFEEDLTLCQPCTLDYVLAWKWYQRLPQWLLRPFSPLL